jgi:hypothetical protein
MRPFSFVKVFANSTVVRRLITRTLTAIVAAFFLIPFSAHAQNTNPFLKYGGRWAGGGYIHLSNETKERIRCQATFTPSEMSLNIALRCAGDSYNFDVQSDLNYDGGSVSGGWNESRLGINGNVRGGIYGGNIRAVIESMAFNATFDLTIAGEQQQIKIQSPGSEISAVFIGLNRISR